MEMRGANSTQFSIEIGTKNRLDRYKMQHKEEILVKLKAKKRYVTNNMAIIFLLDQMNARR